MLSKMPFASNYPATESLRTHSPPSTCSCWCRPPSVAHARRGLHQPRGVAACVVALLPLGWMEQGSCHPICFWQESPPMEAPRRGMGAGSQATGAKDVRPVISRLKTVHIHPVPLSKMLFLSTLPLRCQPMMGAIWSCTVAGSPPRALSELQLASLC